MQWSPQQDDALRVVGEWLRARDKPFLRLFGYAGTGKTTLAVEMGNLVKGGGVYYASFTGKAALVMRRKGCSGASTIHGLIYQPSEDDDGEIKFELNPESDLRHAKLLVIDEVSMVNEEIGKDLLSFGVPILVLGDPAQLPPVKGEGFFINKADIMLTEIHRQAAGNPIIALATLAREGKFIPEGIIKTDEGTTAVLKWDQVPAQSMLNAGQVICGTNATRRKLNNDMRYQLREQGKLPSGLESWRPVVGDKVICLKNKRDRGLFNGGLWRVARIDAKPPIALPSDKNPRPTQRKAIEGIIYMRVESLDEVRPGANVEVPELYFQGRETEMKPRERQRFDEFDFGYAITCHKSQGSQWDNVLVRDQGFVFQEFRDRWRYTAITRAAQKLIVAS